MSILDAHVKHSIPSQIEKELLNSVPTSPLAAACLALRSVSSEETAQAGIGGGEFTGFDRPTPSTVHIDNGQTILFTISTSEITFQGTGL